MSSDKLPNLAQVIQTYRQAEQYSLFIKTGLCKPVDSAQKSVLHVGPFILVLQNQKIFCNNIFFSCTSEKTCYCGHETVQTVLRRHANTWAVDKPNETIGTIQRQS
jgi:hypothetical protein